MVTISNFTKPQQGTTSAVSIQRCRLTGIGNPNIKTRWFHARFIFIIEIPIPQEAVFILKQCLGVVNPVHYSSNVLRMIQTELDFFLQATENSVLTQSIGLTLTFLYMVQTQWPMAL